MDVFKRQLVILYDNYRTAYFNELYYGARLAKFRGWNLGLEIFLAISTSSAVGGWVFFKNKGELLWAVITAMATIVAIIKPIINLPEKIEKYSSLFSGYSGVHYDLKKVISDVTIATQFNPESVTLYDNTLERLKSMAASDDASPDKKLMDRIYKEVNITIPPESLWMPN